MTLLENFRNSSKVFPRCFCHFLNFLENLQKSLGIQKYLKIFGKLQIEMVQK